MFGAEASDGEMVRPKKAGVIILLFMIIIIISSR